MADAGAVEDASVAALGRRVNEAAEVGMQPAVWAQRQPDRVAIYDYTGQDRTFAQLNANANRVARLLRQRGLKAGDSVALACSNRAEFCDVLLGVLRVGMRLHASQLAPDRRRDRLCGAGLRGQGVLRRRADRQGRRDRRRAVPESGAEGGDRRPRGRLRRLRRRAGAAGRLGHRGPGARLHHALHLRHHRPAEGGVSSRA